MKLVTNPFKFHPNWKSIEIQLVNHLESLNKENISESENLIEESIFSTRFTFEWILKDINLFLSKIFDFNNKSRQISLNEIFIKDNDNQLVIADWLSDSLSIFYGECLINNYHLDYDTFVFEKEKVLYFKKGVLFKIKSFNNSIKEANLKFDRKFYFSKLNWKIIPNFNSKHVQVFISILLKKNGSFKRIISKSSFLLDDKLNIIKDLKNPFIKETIRIAKLVPKWTVKSRKGKILPLNFSIDFNEAKKYLN